jgi:fused signal recognition particle receptor
LFEKLKQGLRGVVDRISKSELSDKDLNPILWDLQLQLISNDVAVDVASNVSEDLKERLKGVTLPRFGDKATPIRDALRESIESALVTNGDLDLLELVSEKKAGGEPLVVMFVGINGTGKTTTIAKVTRLLLDNSYKVVLASGDTFRAREAQVRLRRRRGLLRRSAARKSPGPRRRPHRHRRADADK